MFGLEGQLCRRTTSATLSDTIIPFLTNLWRTTSAQAQILELGFFKELLHSAYAPLRAGLNTFEGNYGWEEMLLNIVLHLTNFGKYNLLSTTMSKCSKWHLNNALLECAGGPRRGNGVPPPGWKIRLVFSCCRYCWLMCWLLLLLLCWLLFWLCWLLQYSHPDTVEFHPL